LLSNKRYGYILTISGKMVDKARAGRVAALTEYCRLKVG
jgi:hypothetical protein